MLQRVGLFNFRPVLHFCREDRSHGQAEVPGNLHVLIVQRVLFPIKGIARLNCEDRGFEVTAGKVRVGD